MFWDDIKNLKEWAETISCRLTDLQMKMDGVIQQQEDIASLHLSLKTVDKFDDYMKNVDKLNVMINEFKGCVSLARSSIAERKQVEEEFKELKKVGEIAQQIYKSMLSFIKAGDNVKHEAHYKIDAIYKVLCEKEEKKPPKKRKSVKKKAAVSPAPESV